MPSMPPTFRAFGTRERGYSVPWDKASKGHLRNNPLCRYCELQGNPLTPATRTDHLYPHRVFDGVFWIKHWWIGCCQPCHDGFKQAIERKGKVALDALARALGLPVLGEGEGGCKSPETLPPGPAS